MQQLREWWPGAVAGLVAAAVALAVAEFVARLVDGESLVVAIGGVIIDSSPRSVSGAAIETFGTNDKPALLVGIVATSLLLGAALGPLAMRYRAIGVAALAVFALVGGLVGARDPFTSSAQAWTTALAAGIAGAATLLLLLNAATQAGPSAAAAPPDPQEKRLGRRRFLQFAGGGLAAAAVSVPLGRRLIGPAVDVEAQRAAIVLPPPSTSTPASRPAGAATAALPSPTPSVSAPPKATATAETAPAEATPTATAAAEATPTATARAEATPTATVTPEPTPEPAPVVRAGPATVPGISPLVTPNSKFYRIDTALSVPRIDSTRWRLQLTGMVDRPAEFTFDELLAMSLREESVTLACVSNKVGQGLVGNAYWLGVPLPTLLREAGVQAGATQVIGRAVDGFTVGFPTDVALDGRESMVVVGMNGEPLPAEHGFPARLIVPGLYGYVSATKWLGEIELSTLDSFDSYWVRRRLGPAGADQAAVAHRRPARRRHARARQRARRRRRLGRAERRQRRSGSARRAIARRAAFGRRMDRRRSERGAVRQQLASVGGRLARHRGRVPPRGTRDRSQRHGADGRADGAVSRWRHGAPHDCRDRRGLGPVARRRPAVARGETGSYGQRFASAGAPSSWPARCRL